MFQITLDVFSGRPNPTFFVEGQDARDLVRELTQHRTVLADVDEGYQGLGFRGVVIEPTEDTVAERFDLPPVFRIAGGASMNESKGQEIAERLIRNLTRRASADGIVYDQSVEDKVLELMRTAPTIEMEYESQADPAAEAEEEPADVTCYIELGRFNPAFWNHPDYIRKNNCYNYASNKRTNTFAQPGRGSGHPITALNCADVTRAALSDGLHRRFDCFPDTEKARWLVALVVAPGWDYHWYRKQLEKFWGHKPGGTEARYKDNSGEKIYNPQSCDRGPYTDFCGYFYVPRSQKIK
jgi:hypothetical protein